MEVLRGDKLEVATTLIFKLIYIVTDVQKIHDGRTRLNLMVF